MDILIIVQRSETQLQILQADLHTSTLINLFYSIYSVRLKQVVQRLSNNNGMWCYDHYRTLLVCLCTCVFLCSPTPDNLLYDYKYLWGRFLHKLTARMSLLCQFDEILNQSNYNGKYNIISNNPIQFTQSRIKLKGFNAHWTPFHLTFANSYKQRFRKSFNMAAVILEAKLLY